MAIVGAGPGGPGLLTLRGQAALADAQVVVFDAGVTAGVLDLAAEGAERIRVDEAGGVPPAAVGGLLVARARAGSRVARLVSGDVGVPGEMEALAAAGIPYEVVPGVTPAVAAAAFAGIPAVPSGSASAVILAGAGPEAAAPAVVPWASLGPAFAALLVPVSGATLPAAVEGLIRAGRHPETPAALIVGATRLEQRTITAPLAGLAAEARHAGLDAPAILVVGDVVRLRGRLLWLERRPLFGRRVVVTRPRAQAARLALLLEAYGAEALALPTIRLDPPDDWRPLDDAIRRLPSFAWVVFTSVNGVAAFRERLAAARLDARALAGTRLAAIGPETAEALARVGLRADLVPAEYRAEGLLEALTPHLAAGSEVLLVRAAEAREVLPRELAGRDVRVTVAPAYRTVTVKEGADRLLDLLEARRVDAVTFTSSSTVRGFVALLGPEAVRGLLKDVVLAAIGPITAATIAEYGLEARVMPREYTVPALADAVAAHFSSPA